MEFAVENAQTLKKRSERSGRAQQDRGASAEGAHPAQGAQDEQQARAEQGLPARAAGAGSDGAGPSTASGPRKRKRANGSEVCTSALASSCFVSCTFAWLPICCQ